MYHTVANTKLNPV